MEDNKVNDYCQDLIALHEACLDLLKLVHRFFHEIDYELPWQPTKDTSIDDLIEKTRLMRASLGAEVTEDVVRAAVRLKNCLAAVHGQ